MIREPQVTRQQRRAQLRALAKKHRLTPAERARQVMQEKKRGSK